MAINTDTSGKQKALTMVLNQIERSFGKGAIMRLGDATRMRVETISSGALTLDLALGGGLPKGRVIEIYGPESSGKTTVALHALAEVQRNGGIAAFVDAETRPRSHLCCGIGCRY
jgi:recombination protein RecA